MKWFLSIALVSVVLAACHGWQTALKNIDSEPTAKPTSEVVTAPEVRWTPLNPLRGDKSPQADTLWGDPDRKGPVATRFLIQFSDGFSSSPHIHNITCRGVVISGLVHNNDPSAAEIMSNGMAFTIATSSLLMQV